MAETRKESLGKEQRIPSGDEEGDFSLSLSLSFKRVSFHCSSTPPTDKNQVGEERPRIGNQAPGNGGSQEGERSSLAGSHTPRAGGGEQSSQENPDDRKDRTKVQCGSVPALTQSGRLRGKKKSTHTALFLGRMEPASVFSFLRRAKGTGFGRSGEAPPRSWAHPGIETSSCVSLWDDTDRQTVPKAVATLRRPLIKPFIA